MEYDKIITNEFIVREYVKTCKRAVGRILFDLDQKAWRPEISDLERFCDHTYRELVDIFKGFEKSQEYVLHANALLASNGSKDLAFCLEFGSTQSEVIATHTIGWEFDRLLENYKVEPTPFDFIFLVAAFNIPLPNEQLPLERDRTVGLKVNHPHPYISTR